MIISHKRRYVFIEVPLTASTAIAHDLVTRYDGERVLKKHAALPDFLREYKGEERKYFKFGGVRNPLDTAVSLYSKLIGDHKGQLSQGVKKAHIQEQYAFVMTPGNDFSKYLRRYFRRVYTNFYLSQSDQFDFVYRFENLAEDYATILRRIGIENPEPLPQRNKTEKKVPMADCYPAELQPYAAKVFGPFMKHWKYEFPESWKPTPVIPWTSTFMYNLATTSGNIYCSWTKTGPDYATGGAHKLALMFRDLFR